MAINWVTWDTSVATYDWLAVEQGHQFRQQFIGPLSRKSPAFARNRVEQIINEQLPNKWKSFQHYRAIRSVETDTDAKARLKLCVGQTLLMGCKLSQDAYVWQDIASGVDAEQSMRNSFRFIHGYIDGLKSGRSKLPDQSYFALTLPKAVDTFTGASESYDNVYSVFRTMAGLAIQGLCEQATTKPILPEPGHSLGQVVEWQLPNKANSNSTDHH